MSALRPVVQLECAGKGHITFRRSTDGALLIQTFSYQGQAFNIDFDPRTVRILRDWLGQLLPEDPQPIISISGSAAVDDLIDVHLSNKLGATTAAAIRALNCAVRDLRAHAGYGARAYL